MVGIPRSRGCQLCVKRRVKCDEERPGCGNCRRYKAECPGYNKDFKFVAEKHKVRSKAKVQAEREGRRNHVFVAVQGHHFAAAAAASLSTSAPSLSPLLEPTLSMTPMPSRALYIGNLVDSVRSKIDEPVICLLAWIDLERLGKVAVLDAAIYSVGLYLVGMERSDQDAIDLSWSAYGTSLRVLQSTLEHPREWKSSETLAATILLCLFELFATSISSGSWLKHARGIATLIKQRGPQAHSQGWDALMILSFRGILTMCDALYPSEDACFLAQPEWRHLICDAGRNILMPGVPFMIVNVIDDFFMRLVDLPGILKQTNALRSGDASRVINKRQLVKQLTDYRNDLRAFHRDMESIGLLPDEGPSTDPLSPFPTVLYHKTAGSGAMMMGYWVALLVTEDALNYCQGSPDFPSQKHSLVDKVLRSAEYVGQGPVGLYRISFSIQIAYDFASPEQQRWIETIVPRIRTPPRETGAI